MKSFLKYTVFGMLGLITFLAGVALLSLSLSGDDTDVVFIPYIQEVVPELTTWRIEAYEKRMSEAGFTAVPKEMWKVYLSNFSSLGKLESIGTPGMTNYLKKLSASGKKVTYGVYLVPLSFDTGEAHVELSLHYQEGKVEIEGIRFFADRLVK